MNLAEPHEAELDRVVHPQRPRGVPRRDLHPAAGRLRVDLGRFRLRATRGGAVSVWLGPALRGVVAAALKRQSCRFDLAEQSGRRRYCSGCPHMGECGYGLLYEPDPVGLPSPALGAHQAPSGVVLSPSYPVPRRLRAGDRLAVEVVLTGAAARAGFAAALAGAVASAGRGPGLGPDHVQFDVEADEDLETLVLASEMFPADAGELPGRYPRVRVDLLTPLFLRAESNVRGARGVNRAPTFLDLFRPALRMVRRQFAEAGVELQGDWTELCRLASEVRTRDAAYEPFRQRRWSSRTEHRAELEGVVGQAWFANVPAVLLPWLYWGGRLHIGGQRVAGAGRMRINLE